MVLGHFSKLFLNGALIVGVGIHVSSCDKDDDEEKGGEDSIAEQQVLQTQQPIVTQQTTQALPAQQTTSPADTAPNTSVSDVTMPAEDETMFTLAYSDSEGDKATSCEVEDLHLVSISTACSCDAEGVCQVGLSHIYPYSDSWGFFHYNVTAGGKKSNTSKITITESYCPAVQQVSGATLVADDSSCPDYSSWGGDVEPGDILILQEGGPSAGDHGGVIKAFDEQGCYKGEASTEESPGYAVGLKVDGYGNSISTYNDTKIMLMTRVNGNNPGVYEWDGPLLTGARSSVVLETSGGSTNPASVPDDNDDSSDDPHLEDAGMAATSMRYSVTNKYAIGANGDGSPKFLRLVADNQNKKIKAYINGVERTECQIDIGTPGGSCTNCVADSSSSGREVTDIQIGVSNWAWNKVSYVWTEERTVNGLPRTYWGVSQTGFCTESTNSFADLNHSDLIVDDSYGTTFVATNTVFQTKVPGGTMLHDAIYPSVKVGLGGEYLVFRYLKDEEDNYKKRCDGFVGRAHSAYQDNYNNSSLPTNGSLFTIESDTSGTHIRKYKMTAADEGKLEATLYSESGPTVINASLTLGSWITVVPKIAAP